MPTQLKLLKKGVLTLPSIAKGQNSQEFQENENDDIRGTQL